MYLEYEITVSDFQTSAIMIGRYSQKINKSYIYLLHISINKDKIIEVLVPRIIRNKHFSILKIGQSYHFHIRQYSSVNEIRYKLVDLL